MSVVSSSRHRSIEPCAQVCSPVGIWNCHPIISARYFLDTWQQLLLQQYFTIIVAVHFHSRLRNFIFQQDSTPAHRVRDTIALLRKETADFISPDQWLPSSADINSVDYKIWAVMQQRVYEKCVNDVDKLCQRLLSVWHSIAQNVRRSDRSVVCATHRLCKRAKGCHFEHLMQNRLELSVSTVTWHFASVLNWILL